MKVLLESSEAAILDRVIRPEMGSWPRSAAKAILNISFGSPDKARLSFLMEKAKDGSLSPSETEEIEHYRHVGRLLELMKSRARRSLRNKAAA